MNSTFFHEFFHICVNFTSFMSFTNFHEISEKNCIFGKKKNMFSKNLHFLNHWCLLVWVPLSSLRRKKQDAEARLKQNPTLNKHLHRHSYRRSYRRQPYISIQPKNIDIRCGQVFNSVAQRATRVFLQNLDSPKASEPYYFELC